jgi:hypothetical protein
MVSAIKHFLLVFDHHKGAMVDLKEFGAEADLALKEYAALEREHQYDGHIDIVLIGSDSLETVKLTHANYFDGSATIVSKWLVGL